MKEDQIKKTKERFLAELTRVDDEPTLETLKIKYLGRKAGLLTVLLNQLASLSAGEKKTMGPLVNQAKAELENQLVNKLKQLRNKNIDLSLAAEKVDITQPALPARESGHLHPVTIIQNDLEVLFTAMGFMILDGPELESDYYNFTALNMPANDPARDSQDTFYIKGHAAWVMRTQTSAVQVRALQKYGAPLRAVVPGRCFRNEATDAAHEHTFDQLEGIVVDKNISVANLIAVMKELLRGVLKRDVEVRLRPGHFQFVEPGFELDIKCLVCGGVGCGACKHSGWIETLPCGLVHPEVIKYGGLNPKEWNGFAFGLGMTRLIMQKYGINDMRHLMSGDLRFIKQF
ncbi:MAG: phenylalanine--tRNA ligase subunit alpha [bacterium]|nr:phenylalanine--tRNA ligase subunit alpha [bacterium]